MSTDARVRALLRDLVVDARLLGADPPALPAAVAAHRDLRTGPYGDTVSALAVPAGRVPELREAVTSGESLPVVLVADDGLVGLAAARNVLLDSEDDVELIGLRVSLPAGHDPAEAIRALLGTLSFSVPAAIAVPAAGHGAALAVLADDGAEQALFRAGAGPEAAADLSALLRAAAQARVRFTVAGLAHAVTGHDGLGLLNLMAAVGTSVAGAGQDEVTAALTDPEPDSVLLQAAAVEPGAVRRLLQSVDCPQPAGLLTAVAGLGVLSAD